MSTDALASRVLQHIIAVDDTDLANYGTIEVKCTRHVGPVAKVLQTFASGPLVDDDVDVDMW